MEEDKRTRWGEVRSLGLTLATVNRRFEVVAQAPGQSQCATELEVRGGYGLGFCGLRHELGLGKKNDGGLLWKELSVRWRLCVPDDTKQLPS